MIRHAAPLLALTMALAPAPAALGGEPWIAPLPDGMTAPAEVHSSPGGTQYELVAGDGALLYVLGVYKLSTVPKHGDEWLEWVADVGEGMRGSVQVVGPYVYWIENPWGQGYSIRRVPLAGGAMEVLYESPRRAAQLAMDDTHLFWMHHGALEGECHEEYLGCGQNPLPPETVCEHPGAVILSLRKP